MSLVHRTTGTAINSIEGLNAYKIGIRLTQFVDVNPPPTQGA